MCLCFDKLFNLQIPASTDDIVVIRPSSKTFVNGIAQTYTEDLEDEDKARLKGHLSTDEFI